MYAAAAEAEAGAEALLGRRGAGAVAVDALPPSAAVAEATEEELELFSEDIATRGLMYLVAGMVALLAVIAIIVTCLAAAPTVTALVLLAIVVLASFVATEDGGSLMGWHASWEYENRFWGIWWMSIAIAFLWASDSPFYMGGTWPRLFVSLIPLVVVGMLSYLIDRNSTRTRLAAPSKILGRVDTNALSDIQGAGAKESAQQLERCIDVLDLANPLIKRFQQKSICEAQDRILAILRDADARTLNYVLTNIRLPLLIYKLKDYDLMLGSGGARTAVLDFLVEERLAELEVSARASIIDALQKLRLSAHKKAEGYVKQILLETKALYLTQLKVRMDTKGNVHSMHQLMFRDIKSDVVRDEILAHIRLQATIALDRMHASARLTNMVRPRWRKVLSDVDDTLCSSGGKFPAGCDASYPKHTVYPGVCEFYRQLALGKHRTLAQTEGTLAFLSARPHVYDDLSESVSYRRFTKLVEKDGHTAFHTMPTLLAGNLSSGYRMFRGDFEPIAQTKYRNFERCVASQRIGACAAPLPRALSFAVSGATCLPLPPTTAAARTLSCGPYALTSPSPSPPRLGVRQQICAAVP